MNNELTHHGIMGMKWGVRRYQPYTDGKKGRFLGKKPVSQAVQDQKDNVKKRKLAANEAGKAYTRSTHYGLTGPTKTAIINLQKAKKEHTYSKEDLKNTKILEKIASKQKTDKQLSLEKKYMSTGMGKDEAAVAAYQNIRSKQILIAVGAVVVTSAVGYAAYKKHEHSVDKIIKSGQILQNIAGDDTKGVRDAFYGAHNKVDMAKYKGIYGRTLQTKHNAAFAKQVKVLSDIKQASPKSAQAVLQELVTKDQAFASALNKNLMTNKLSPKYTLKTIKASRQTAAGVVNKNTYEVFNALLVDHSPEHQPLIDKYYKALKDKGYNAIKDVNDAKYSGYKASNPLILFGSAGKVEVKSVKQLTDKAIRNAADIGYADIIGKDILTKGSVVATAILGVKSLQKNKAAKTKVQIADSYRKENPGTKLNNTEIIRMLERSS